MASQGPRNILVTGGAGFIGSHLVDKLLAHGDRVTVLDNFDEYYSAEIKRDNIRQHRGQANCKLVEGDLRHEAALQQVFRGEPFDVIIHLAAMAGVRPSLENPALYMDVNVNGTQNIIDFTLKHSPKARFVFGSSSSVYGGNRDGDSFKETDRVDRPFSPYAASKAANELQCYAAHHTTGLQFVCLRFFTVFGPRQRPDLAIHKFAAKIERGEQIDVFGDGTSKRDYTFVHDIVQGIEAATQAHLTNGFEIINLGRSEPVVLMDMIKSIEKALGKEARIAHKPFQTGDVPYTYASIDKARQLLGYNPKTPFDEGIKQFVDWYRARLDTTLPLRQ